MALVELQDVIGYAEVAVVVTDDHDRFVAPLQLGNQLGIKDSLVPGILLGSPLVEDVDRSVFEVRADKRQAPALTLRERRRRKRPVCVANAAVELQSCQVRLRLVAQLACALADTVHVFEQMKVGE